MNLTIRTLGLLLAAALPLVPTSSSAADSAQPEESAPTDDAPQELEEILVRGKKLKQQIADAEDDFFNLFNKVNTDDDYDTSCVYLNLDTEGLTTIKSRVCIPGFVADAIAQSFVAKAECSDFGKYDLDYDGRVSWYEVNEVADEEERAKEAGDMDAGNLGSAVELRALFTSLDRNHDRYLSILEYAERNSVATPSPCHQPPPPQLVLMEGTKKWYEHSMQVINSDPRLQKMAGHLDDLYHELFVEESRIKEAKARLDATGVPVVARPNRGPRVR